MEKVLNMSEELVPGLSPLLKLHVKKWLMKTNKFPLAVNEKQTRKMIHLARSTDILKCGLTGRK